MEPDGPVDLVCERQDRYVTHTFQILPDSSIGSKPVLLSGSDSERLGLITVHADEIHFLSSKVETTTAEHENLPGIQCARLWDVASHHVETIPETKLTMACNHLRQLHKNTANPCTPAPSPSKPVKVLSKRQLPLPGKLRKEDILDQDVGIFKGLGQLGPPVHCQVN